MKELIKYRIGAAILWLVLVFIPINAMAGLVPDCAGSTCTLCHVLQLISNIAFFLVKDVMPPLAGLLFLIGGIMMIAAAGSEERYKKGRQILIDAAIGVVIVLASWIVINTLITTLGTRAVDGFQPQSWWQPPMCQ